MKLLRAEHAYCGPSVGRDARKEACRHAEARRAHACNFPLGSRHARGERGPPSDALTRVLNRSRGRRDGESKPSRLFET